MFAAHFGDATPACVRQCDVCKSPRAVEKLIGCYYRDVCRKQEFRTQALKITDDDDQYEGGRRGRKREHDLYDEIGNRCEDERSGLSDIVRKQFELRRKVNNNNNSGDDVSGDRWNKRATKKAKLELEKKSGGFGEKLSTYSR